MMAILGLARDDDGDGDRGEGCGGLVCGCAGGVVRGSVVKGWK